MKVFRNILFCFFGSLAIVSTACLVYYFSVTKGVRLDISKLNFTANCVNIYDAEEASVIQCATDGKKDIKLSALPDYVTKAFLSVEDKNFYTHNGFDYKRMGMALWRNLKSFSFKEGASTISQQLVKNTQLTPEKTVERKLKELKLTKQLEKKFTKDQIMEMYLNTIYFGHSCFGIEEASRFYFDVSASELTAGQSAVLAGLIRSPNNYSPFKNPQACLSRRNHVLQTMKKYGYLSDQEFTEAEKEDLPEEKNARSNPMKNYCEATFDELENLVGENVYGGLKIYTFLDRELQKEAENLSEETNLDKSFCVIDSKEHGIKAFFSTIGQAKRSPASTIKPLLVYAPAIEENLISPATPILDEKIDYGGYSPQNYDHAFHGYVSAREALAKSYNVPAVKILNDTGIEKSVKYLKKAGLTTEKSDETLALALGGMHDGYSLPALCAAYSSFSNQGTFFPCSFIKRIENAQGKTIYRKKTEGRKVFSEDTTAILNDMLQTTVKDGTAKKLSDLPYEICAKTGTKGTEEGNTDAYCISYSSRDVVGVWLGSAKNVPAKKLTGGGTAANFNLELLKILYKNTQPERFANSDNVLKLHLSRIEYESKHILLRLDENAPVTEKTFDEIFKKTNVPIKYSTYFSVPTLELPQIFINNIGVCIELCYAEYYSILINKQSKEGFFTVYQGKIKEKIIDADVTDGEHYIYSVTPYYGKFAGETIVLPEIIYLQ